MSAKVRVDRPHNHGPRLAHALVLGVLLGIVTKLIDPIISLNFPNVRFRAPGWLILQFLGPFLVLALLQKHCRHRWWAFAIGAIFAACFAITATVFPMPGYELHWGGTIREIWFPLTGVLVITGGIGGLLNLGLTYVKDAVFGRPLVQDGTMCPKCAYCISRLPQNRCPECGATFELPDLSPDAPSLSLDWPAVRFSAPAFVPCMRRHLRGLSARSL